MPLARSVGVVSIIRKIAFRTTRIAFACAAVTAAFSGTLRADEKPPASAVAVKTAATPVNLPDAPTPQPEVQAATQAPSTTQSTTTTQTGTTQSTTPDQKPLSAHDQAERDVKAEEKQRVLGVLPQFNTIDNFNAPPLSPGQKFDLAWHSAIDPVSFGVAAVDGAISQAENDFPGYGQGAQGYFKRFGASYVDSFDGTMMGNAVLPVLLHQDPRYFRMGHGKFSHRLWYSITTTVRCKGDDGHWQFNTSNVAGNFIAGGISNIYYPASDRGFGLTIGRATTVTAEGTLGALFVEFWPDIRDYVFKKHKPDN